MRIIEPKQSLRLLTSEDISDSSMLIQFYKKAGYISSYAFLADLYHTVQGESSSAKLTDSFESLNRMGLIKEIELNPTNFRLTPEGEKEAIKLLTINEGDYPLNNYEISIINYTIENLHVWNGQINLESNTQEYLYKKEGFFDAKKLQVVFSDNIREYLYENDFIENYPQFHSMFRFKYGKGEQLHRAGTIEKYWKREVETNSKTSAERKQSNITINIKTVSDSNFNFQSGINNNQEKSSK